ncbi:MAG TPA: hypothetical protein VKA09_06545 [Nitrososphaeraceae archaeon]|nr:hypothetical protein [Nitrososphaeraceae archaeon]
MSSVRDNRSIRVFSVESAPFGLAFSEWCVRWLKWCLEQPIEDNPAKDMTGKNCCQNQSGPVWFLAGTFGGPVMRRCTIPTEKAIMFPILEKECSFAEDKDITTEADLISRTKDLTSRISHLEASVDGVTLQNLSGYRVQTPVFDLVFPKNNIYSVHEGPTQATSNGFWILLEPLSAGEHMIYFKGVHRQPDFHTQVTYELFIK